MPELADATVAIPDAIPYSLVAIVVGALATVAVVLYRALRESEAEKLSLAKDYGNGLREFELEGQASRMELHAKIDRLAAKIDGFGDKIEGCAERRP